MDVVYEERSGSGLASMIQITEEENKTILLQIMAKIHDFCELHGIQYSLGYGTLLGAVRHKGFIPWDDDIDIIMKRTDYMKFVTVFKDRPIDGLQLMSLETNKDYNLLVAKIIDTRTILVENINESIELGVYVDIFVVDNLLSSFELSCRYADKNNLLRIIYMLKIIKVNKNRVWWKNSLLKAFRFLLRPIDCRKIALIITNRCSKYLYNGKSEYVGAISLYTYKHKEIFRREWLTKYILIPFENYHFYITSNYDDLLRNLYGDYLTLPPIEKRVTHHDSVAYWRNDDEIIKGVNYKHESANS